MNAVVAALDPGPAGHVLACAECELASGPYPARGEAELLAETHDRLHHGGRRTAEVSDGQVCESCQQAPATRTWTYPAAGAPFALCSRCAADVPGALGGGER